MKQISLLLDDNTGEVVRRVEKNTGSMLGEGWIVMYDIAIDKILEEAPNFSTMKVFLKLASMQTFEAWTVTTIQNVARRLGMGYKTAWEAFKWLEAHHYIKRSYINGSPAYLINPQLTTRGRKSLPQKRSDWAGAASAPNSPAAPVRRTASPAELNFSDDEQLDKYVNCP